jgi:hypothetical protein
MNSAAATPSLLGAGGGAGGAVGSTPVTSASASAAYQSILAREGDLWQRLSALREFAEINYTAFYKAIKKHDKVLKKALMERVLAAIEQQPFVATVLEARGEGGGTEGLTPFAQASTPYLAIAPQDPVSYDPPALQQWQQHEEQQRQWQQQLHMQRQGQQAPSASSGTLQDFAAQRGQFASQGADDGADEEDGRSEGTGGSGTRNADSAAAATAGMTAVPELDDDEEEDEEEADLHRHQAHLFNAPLHFNAAGQMTPVRAARSTHATRRPRSLPTAAAYVAAGGSGFPYDAADANDRYDTASASGSGDNESNGRQSSANPDSASMSSAQNLAPLPPQRLAASASNNSLSQQAGAGNGSAPGSGTASDGASVRSRSSSGQGPAAAASTAASNAASNAALPRTLSRRTMSRRDMTAVAEGNGSTSGADLQELLAEASPFGSLAVAAVMASASVSVSATPEEAAAVAVNASGGIVGLGRRRESSLSVVNSGAISAFPASDDPRYLARPSAAGMPAAAPGAGAIKRGRITRSSTLAGISTAGGKSHSNSGAKISASPAMTQDDEDDALMPGSPYIPDLPNAAGATSVPASPVVCIKAMHMSDFTKDVPASSSLLLTGTGVMLSNFSLPPVSGYSGASPTQASPRINSFALQPSPRGIAGSSFAISPSGLGSSGFNIGPSSMGATGTGGSRVASSMSSQSNFNFANNVGLVLQGDGTEDVSVSGTAGAARRPARAQGQKESDPAFATGLPAGVRINMSVNASSVSANASSKQQTTASSSRRNTDDDPSVSWQPSNGGPKNGDVVLPNVSHLDTMRAADIVKALQLSLQHVGSTRGDAIPGQTGGNDTAEMAATSPGKTRNRDILSNKAVDDRLESVLEDDDDIAGSSVPASANTSPNSSRKENRTNKTRVALVHSDNGPESAAPSQMAADGEALDDESIAILQRISASAQARSDKRPRGVSSATSIAGSSASSSSATSLADLFKAPQADASATRPVHGGESLSAGTVESTDGVPAAANVTTSPTSASKASSDKATNLAQMAVLPTILENSTNLSISSVDDIVSQKMPHSDLTSGSGHVAPPVPLSKIWAPDQPTKQPNGGASMPAARSSSRMQPMPMNMGMAMAAASIMGPAGMQHMPHMEDLTSPGDLWSEYDAQHAQAMYGHFELALKDSFEYMRDAVRMLDIVPTAKVKNLAQFSIIAMECRKRVRAVVENADSTLRFIHESILATKLELFRYMVTILIRQFDEVHMFTEGAAALEELRQVYHIMFSQYMSEKTQPPTMKRTALLRQLQGTKDGGMRAAMDDDDETSSEDGSDDDDDDPEPQLKSRPRATSAGGPSSTGTSSHSIASTPLQKAKSGHSAAIGKSPIVGINELIGEAGAKLITLFKGGSHKAGSHVSSTPLTRKASSLRVDGSGSPSLSIAGGAVSTSSGPNGGLKRSNSVGSSLTSNLAGSAGNSVADGAFGQTTAHSRLPNALFAAPPHQRRGSALLLSDPLVDDDKGKSHANLFEALALEAPEPDRRELRMARGRLGSTGSFDTFAHGNSRIRDNSGELLGREGEVDTEPIDQVVVHVPSSIPDAAKTSNQSGSAARSVSFAPFVVVDGAKETIPTAAAGAPSEPGASGVQTGLPTAKSLGPSSHTQSIAESSQEVDHKGNSLDLHFQHSGLVHSSTAHHRVMPSFRTRVVDDMKLMALGFYFRSRVLFMEALGILLVRWPAIKHHISVSMGVEPEEGAAAAPLHKLLWRRWRPSILEWLAEYKWKKYLIKDIAAGITSGIVLIPQGLAYATLAGVPPVYGLYTGFPGIIYSVLGTSKHAAIGPMSIPALLLAAGVNNMDHPPATQEAYIAQVMAVTFLCGLLCFALGWLNLGFIVRFISRPVLSGFTSAASVLTMASVIKDLIGVPMPRGQVLQDYLPNIANALPKTHILTLLTGVASLALLIYFPKWKKTAKIPAPLLTVALMIPIVAFIMYVSGDKGSIAASGNYFTSTGVALVGVVPSSFPHPQLPPLSGETFKELIPPAVSAAFVGFIERCIIYSLSTCSFTLFMDN